MTIWERANFIRCFGWEFTVMAMRSEDLTSGGTEHSAVDIQPDPEAIAQLVAHLIQRSGVFSADTPIGEIENIRSQAGRSKLLEQLVSAVRPDGASLDVWLKWFSGETPPFSRISLKKPVSTTESAGRILSRSVTRRSDSEKQLAAANAALAIAQDRKDKAEKQALFDRVVESSCLEWIISYEMLSYMRELFAMGPAWTLLRAISSFIAVSEEDVAKMSDTQRTSYDKRMKERAKETDDILVGLDFFCGDRRFETTVRMAILKVIEDFAYRRGEMEKEGVKARSVRQLRRSARSDGSDVRQVFSGLPTA